MSQFAYPIGEAAKSLGISASKLEEIIKRGDIQVKWIDGKRVIDADELPAYVKGLPTVKVV